jgi:hypothetical protein
MTSKPSPAPGRFHRIDWQRVGQSLGRLLLPSERDYKGAACILSSSLSIDEATEVSTEKKTGIFCIENRPMLPYRK